MLVLEFLHRLVDEIIHCLRILRRRLYKVVYIEGVLLGRLSDSFYSDLFLVFPVGYEALYLYKVSLGYAFEHLRFIAR